MNDETFEALKDIIAYTERELHKKSIEQSYHWLVRVNVVKNWIDKVSKDYGHTKD